MSIFTSSRDPPKQSIEKAATLALNLCRRLARVASPSFAAFEIGIVV
jgi:hypothetical protein